MIRPKIPLVQNGQRLTSDLVNSMIHRTEYAADLLRQYRLTAGTEMYVEPHYDGTRVSYLQPVGGGQNLPPPDFGGEDVYRILIGSGIVYNSDLNEGLVLTASDFGTFGTPNTFGLRKNFVLGYGLKDSSRQQALGIIYNGVSGSTATYPGSEWTELWDIDVANFNIIVGSYFSAPDYDYQGLIYNLQANSFQTLNRPDQDTNGTYLTGIYNGIIIGGQAFGTANSFFYNGAFNSLPSGFFPYGIWENTIVGSDGYIYKIGEGITRQLVIPELGRIDATGIYKNYVCGQKNSSPFSGFVYNLNTDEYVIKFGARFWAIG